MNFSPGFVYLIVLRALPLDAAILSATTASPIGDGSTSASPIDAAANT
jgi:hypothetical protein